jgi:hypothetical protein
MTDGHFIRMSLEKSYIHFNFFFSIDYGVLYAPAEAPDFPRPLAGSYWKLRFSEVLPFGRKMNTICSNEQPALQNWF